MSHSDSNFYKSFAFVLGALVVFTLLIMYLANLMSPNADDDPLAVAQQQRAIAPVGKVNVADAAAEPVADTKTANVTAATTATTAAADTVTSEAETAETESVEVVEVVEVAKAEVSEPVAVEETAAVTTAVAAKETQAAASHTITAIGVKFKPMFLYIEPGDTVNWTGMSGHNVETIETMSPEGLEKINSELGANVTATFASEGIIVFKCTPHWGARMGGIVVVGKPSDASAILDRYMASIETDRQNLPAKGLLKKLRKDMEKKGLI